MDSKRARKRPVMHTKQRIARETLSELVDWYQATGRYVLTREQVPSLAEIVGELVALP